MKIILIAAIANDGAMGAAGTLPWHCPVDLRHFRAMTMGRVCLMGRKTAESLKKPLRDRVNVVMTRDRTWSKPGFHTVHNMWDIKRVLAKYEQQELWVIGGAELYRKFLPICDLLHLTVLDLQVPDADTWFPVKSLGRFHGVYTQVSTDPNVVFWTMQPNQITTSKRAARRCTLVDQTRWQPNWLIK